MCVRSKSCWMKYNAVKWSRAILQCSQVVKQQKWQSKILTDSQGCDYCSSIYGSDYDYPLHCVPRTQPGTTTLYTIVCTLWKPEHGIKAWRLAQEYACFSNWGLQSGHYIQWTWGTGIWGWGPRDPGTQTSTHCTEDTTSLLAAFSSLSTCMWPLTPMTSKRLHECRDTASYGKVVVRHFFSIAQALLKKPWVWSYWVLIRSINV